MVRHQRVEWIHTFVNEPVNIYSEIDDDGWEQRKVEIYRDGHSSFASATDYSGDSAISEVRLPSLDEINEDPQFVGREITAAEFSAAWVVAVAASLS